MRLKLFLVLIFALPHNYGYSQSYVQVTKQDRRIEYATIKDGVENGAHFSVYNGELEDVLIYNLGFPVLQFMVAQGFTFFYNFEENDFGEQFYYREGWGVEYCDYDWKCMCTSFYPSGNLHDSGILLIEDVNAPEQWTSWEYGDWKREEDFGDAMHRKYEVGYNIVHDTLLDGQLNGSQVYLNKETQCLRRINFYELGELKAQFSFNDDGSINEISYCITKNDLTEDFEYKCTLIPFMPDGTMLPSCTLLFDDFPDEGLSRIY